MKFENAMVAMRKGYKVQRKQNKERLNGVCFFIKDGVMYSEQTHELSSKVVFVMNYVNQNALMAEDWEVLK